MSFYIVFNNIQSFFETSRTPDSIEDNEAAAACSIEKVFREVSVSGQTTVSPEPEASISLKSDDCSENSVFAIGGGGAAAITAGQTSELSASNNETAQLAAEKQNLKTQDENVGQNDIYEKYHSLLNKFEISLRYRYDLADVFKSDGEMENFRQTNRLSEKNYDKQRDARQEDSEKRFREMQAENFRKCLKQKRFASQLQDKNV